MKEFVLVAIFLPVLAVCVPNAPIEGMKVRTIPIKDMDGYAIPGRSLEKKDLNITKILEDYDGVVSVIMHHLCHGQETQEKFAKCLHKEFGDFKETFAFCHYWGEHFPACVFLHIIVYYPAIAHNITAYELFNFLTIESLMAKYLEHIFLTHVWETTTDAVASCYDKNNRSNSIKCSTKEINRIRTSSWKFELEPKPTTTTTQPTAQAPQQTTVQNAQPQQTTAQQEETDEGNTQQQQATLRELIKIMRAQNLLKRRN